MQGVLKASNKGTSNHYSFSTNGYYNFTIVVITFIVFFAKISFALASLVWQYSKIKSYNAEAYRSL